MSLKAQKGLKKVFSKCFNAQKSIARFSRLENIQGHSVVMLRILTTPQVKKRKKEKKRRAGKTRVALQCYPNFQTKYARSFRV